MQLPDVFGLLFPNIWTVISQLCATAVLFFLMYKLAYKPVKKILDTRSEYEQSRISEADALKEENTRLNEEAKQNIIEANKSAEDIVSSAREEAETIKRELVDQAKEQSKQLMDNAQKEIEVQRSKMLQDLHAEIVDATISATEKMLKSKIQNQEDKDNIDTFVKEVINK
ncbi:MAG: F0F1 ATP synthase subunit B [Erysipelotrichaceae bacterium]|nr:F0F1 ATP synthase subunit B [Erysipelotrichaceae bacterium]MBO7698337.1 F0F1 ATP synthase subunit B [Erysipelotrichaceae bacterium]MBP5280517.1 F0F1 ATP synthase subunit B [Erysipelotrichaceae bacterium]